MEEINNYFKKNIFSYFCYICKRYPQNTALYYKQNGEIHTIDYDSLLRLCLKTKILLENNCIRKNDRVGILMENSPLWVIAFMGILAQKGIVVPINPLAKREEINFFFSHSQTKLIFATQSLHSKLSGINVPVICLNYDYLKELPSNLKIKNFSNKHPEEHDSIALINYTSGTTNMPKGVMLSHKNLIANAESLQRLNLLDKNDCVISLLPLYHAYPLMVNLLLPLLVGAKISYPSSLDTKEILSCMRATKVSVLVGVPQLFYLFHEKIKSSLYSSFLKRYFLESILSLGVFSRKIFKVNINKFILHRLHNMFGNEIRLFVTGGAKINPTVIRDFYKWGFTLLEGYGLTETSPVATFNTPKDFRIGSVGKPIPGVELKIDSPDLSGIGEIIIKGDNVFKGYYKNPALTLEVLKNNWFHTQDLGYIDKKGFVFIKGRKKELIVLSSGKKVVPEDIESHYLESPYIEEICIFARNDGERNYLFAVIKPCLEQFKKDKIIQIKDKIRWEIETISKKLPPHKRIKGYIITNTPLPKTSLGKIKRYVVEELYKDLHREKREKTLFKDDHLTLLSYPVNKKILSLLSQRLKRPVDIDDHLELDLGIDSLALIDLLLEIQKITGVSISPQERIEIGTIRDILNKVTNVKLKIHQERQNPSVSFNNIEEAIKAPLSPKEKSCVSTNIRFLPKIINIILALILKITLRTLFMLSVKNTFYLPQKNSFIICPNHTSYLDGPTIAASLPINILLRTYFLGYAVYFDNFMVRWAKKLFRLVSIDPATNPIDALRICNFILNENKVLCLFPEGKRSLSGTINNFKPGTGILIKELNVPVIPVYIKGTYKIWPAYRRLPKLGKITVFFGKPITIEELKEGIDQMQIKSPTDIYKIIANNLRKKMLSLTEKFK